MLHDVAVEVTDINEGIRELVADMFETMDAAPGVGLAAPQVGVNLRIFVFDYPTEDGEPRRGVAINPDILISPVPIREPSAEDEEGCLSFPGERFSLVRAERALLRALDIEGNSYEMECDGWFARIVQHEFDHLNGIMYVDRLEPKRAHVFGKVEKRRGWGIPGNSWLPGVDHLEG